MEMKTRIKHQFLLVSVLVLLTAQGFAAEPGLIIFSSVSSGKWDLRSIRPDGTGLRQITDSPEDEQSPAVSPDGKEILYVADRTLWIIRSNGTSKKALPLPVGIYAQPAWAPDGLGAAFVKYKVLPADQSEIWLIKRRDNRWGEPARISIHPPMRLYPAFSPDGSSLAYAEFTRDKLLGVVEEIGILDLGEKTFKKITDDGADSFDPAWSPTGDRIAYTSNKNGNYDIWVKDLKSGKQSRLTRNRAYDGEPAWSPDGSKIAFISSRSGNREIWIVSAKGESPIQVTKMGTTCKGAFWVSY